MDSRSFCASIERSFKKGEYIAINKMSFKMLSEPKSLSLQDGSHVFAFLVNSTALGEDICKKLADYAESAVFYKRTSKNSRVYVIPVFIGSDFSDSELALFSKKIFHTGKSDVICAGFDAERSCSYIADRLPCFRSAELSRVADFAKKLMGTNKTEE